MIKRLWPLTTKTICQVTVVTSIPVAYTPSITFVLLLPCINHYTIFNINSVLKNGQ